MRYIFNFFSSYSIPRQSIGTLDLFAHIFTRCKSSNTRSSRKISASKETRLKESNQPSLYQKITEIVGTENPSIDDSIKDSVSDEIDIRTPTTKIGSPDARQIVQVSTFHANAKEPNSENDVSRQTHVGNANSDDISPIVHRITEIVRSSEPGIRIEERLEDLGFSFGSEIVDKVLKRCFKVGHLALRFFNWVKLHPGFCHTTKTYNTMIYIAGEAEEFDLVEKLVGEMDEELCPKNIKTWTILISHYGKGNQIGKALSTFEKMRKSGFEPDSGVYEAILRALCIARKPELALEFYKEMVLRNMVVDMNLYGMLMDCLSTSGNIEVVFSIGDDMVKIAQISEIEVYTRILRSFCISGKLKEARELFEEIKKKMSSVDSKMYEVLVKGLCRASRMDDAVQVVEDMKKNSVVNSNIYGSLIDGFFRTGDVQKALELLRGMREFGCMPMVSSYTQMIRHLFWSDEYVKACELYEEMLSSGVEPDIVAITAMVAGHVRHNRISEAWKIFESMKDRGIKPTWKSYSVFIKELCKVSEPDEAFKLLNEMSDSNINATEDIFRLVTSSLTRKGELENARKVEQMCRTYKLHTLEAKPVYRSADNWSLHDENEVSNCSVNHDVNSIQIPHEYSGKDLKEACRILSSSTDWSSMQEDLEGCMIHFTPKLVEAILRSCRAQGCAALQFFSWVRKQAGYKHTTETYNMAIKISGSGKDFKHMRNLYQEMRRSGCSITPNTWTIMIAQYGQAGLTEIALKTFKEMKSDGFLPDGSTYKYLIVFLCGKKGRKVDEAIKIFQEMISAGYMPDKEMPEIYLSSLCESGKLVEARTSVKSLCKRGFTKQFGYSLLVKSLCRAERVEEALVLADEMKQLGCKIDQYIYVSIVHALLRGGRLDEALDKVEAMKRAGISQTIHIHTSLIVHFCKEKQIEKAEEIFRKMREEGCKPTVVTYSALIRGYMNMGMVSDAWNIFRRMKLKGPIPDFETFSMFMTCLCKAGRSEEALQLIHEMLEHGIIPSTVNYRTVFHGLNREGKQDLAHSVLQTKWLLKRKRMFIT